MKFFFLMAIAAIALPLSAWLPSANHRTETITIDVSDRTLEFRGKEYAIAVGAPETPTPVGVYEIDYKGFTGSGINAATFASSEISRIGYGRYAIHAGGATGFTQGCAQMDDSGFAVVFSELEVGDRVAINP